MRTILQRGLLAAALGVAVAQLSGCGADANSQELTQREAPASVPVEVAEATRGTLDPSYAASGNLEAERDARLITEVAGQVLEVLVEEGDRVAAGQVLARVDTTRAELELEQAQSVVNRLRHDAERHELLLERKMVSREAYDRARYERDTQQAVVDIARLTVTKGALRAPYAGVITRRHVKAGQWLDTQTPAFEIADFSELKVRIDVPEHVSGLLREGQPVALRADALGNSEFAAVVERTSPIVDRATGTVGVTVAVDNPDQRLRPGLFVRLDVRYDHIAEATLVPKSAVINDGPNTRVFVVADGKADERRVALGLETGDRVQVLSGLEPGATVVTVGHNALNDGDPVQIVNPVQAVATSAATASL
jgi:membrane fusion protein (multidrug efflux system)